MSINTKSVHDRRTLAFTSPEQALADARAIARADTDGSLRRSGNWSPGEVFTHLAAFMNYPYDGYPKELNPPAIIRFVFKFLKNRFLSSPLPAGFRIHGIPAGTVGAERVSTAEGLARLEQAWSRLKAAPPGVPNPVFGPLTHEQWIQLHLRHSELHQSFLHPS